jgi:hypothetical protein
MRALFALVMWLASFSAGGMGVGMADESDEIHLADMAAPPWTPSANEQITRDHAGFDPCEQLVTMLAPRGVSKVAGATYTISRRWGKILRAKILSGSGDVSTTTLVTCWIDPNGHAWIVVKMDDGKP